MKTLFTILFAMIVSSAMAEPIVIGLDADMSSGAALGGESIRRGAVLAIKEINQSGGLLGRKLELLTKDHRGIPARGADNMHDFAKVDNLLAVIGGVHTPVALAQLEAIHQHKIIYLDPWAAGTPIIDNGYSPNYAFRVSVRDEHAGGFLVQQILKLGYKRPALFLENTGWGRSNKIAIEQALAKSGKSAATVQWFYWGTQNFKPQIKAAVAAGSDSIILVANANEGVKLVKQLAERNLPIISHWGITGGDFFEKVGEDMKKVDLYVLQTYSFFQPTFEDKNQAFIKSYFDAFPANSIREIIAPVGSAHAYDLVHLLAKAVVIANSLERPAVQKALENIQEHHGLVRHYTPPFTPDSHDALDVSDFRLCQFDSEGAIIPLGE